MNLHDYIAKFLTVPFKYGVNDCMTFTVGWVEAATGNKYLPEKLWTSEKQALAILKKRGGIKNIFDENFTRVEPHFALDGDLALVDGTASVFTGARCVSTGTTGLAFKNRLLATDAWRLPCRK